MYVPKRVYLPPSIAIGGRYLAHFSTKSKSAIHKYALKFCIYTFFGKKNKKKTYKKQPKGFQKPQKLTKVFGFWYNVVHLCNKCKANHTISRRFLFTCKV